MLCAQVLVVDLELACEHCLRFESAAATVSRAVVRCINVQFTSSGRGVTHKPLYAVCCLRSACKDCLDQLPCAHAVRARVVCAHEWANKCLCNYSCSAAVSSYYLRSLCMCTVGHTEILYVAYHYVALCQCDREAELTVTRLLLSWQR
jgi:hypothetical protein